MALTTAERAICEKLGYDSSGVLSPAQQAKSGATSLISQAQAALNNYVESPQSVINNAKAGLTTNVATVLPGDTLVDVQKVLAIINNCIYLSSSDSLSNPISLVTALLRSIRDKVGDFIDDYIYIPEFFSGKILSLLQEIYGSVLPGARQVSNSLISSDYIINCLTNFCGGEFASKVSSLTTETQSLYTSLKIVDNPLSPNYGSLDTNSLYTAAGLGATAISKITDVTGTITGVKASGQSSIDSFVSNAKRFKKLGSIVF